MEGIIPGRIVHFFSKSFSYQPRAAMIVRAWGDGGTVNLTVFPDWGNDGHRDEPAFWATSIQHKSALAEYIDRPDFGSSYWDWPARDGATV